MAKERKFSKAVRASQGVSSVEGSVTGLAQDDPAHVIKDMT